MREDLLRIIFGSVARLALVLLSTIADIVGLLLREANDLLLASDGKRLLLSVSDDGIGLSGGRCQKLVALLEDATRLLPLLGIAHANLVKNVEEDLSLNHLELRVLAERRLGLFDDALKLIDQALDSLPRKVIARHSVSFHRLRINCDSFSHSTTERDYRSLKRSLRAASTFGVTNSDTSPPNEAICRTTDDER